MTALETAGARRVLSVFGTRPEAIKLAPVVRTFEARDDVVHATCVTGQHREMLDQVLSAFDLTPRYDLKIMRAQQHLAGITASALTGLRDVLDDFKPDWVIVQGDTTTAFAGALAAFYDKAPVAHVEAGLRTGDINSPWPEEINRQMVGRLASLHLPPTEQAKDNLLREGVCASRILVTGNTVIDALKWIGARFEADPTLRGTFEQRFEFLPSNRRLILVTGHRRENLDGGLAAVCRALRRIAERDDVEIVYPVHLNPVVQTTVREALGGRANIHLIEPLDYLAFVYLMARAHVIVTDSGGIQEEAPSLGKPVLVTRDTTERPEAVAAGTAQLVGAEEAPLFEALTRLLDDEAAYGAMSKAANPFGDGHAARRVVDRVMEG